MILETYSATVAMELNIASAFVRNAVKLLEEGATIPFIVVLIGVVLSQMGLK